MQTAGHCCAPRPVLAAAAASPARYRVRRAARRTGGRAPGGLAFGSRQPAGCAARALPPAVNQPAAAVPVIGALADALEDALPPAARGAGRDETVQLTTVRLAKARLARPLPGRDDRPDRAFTAITARGTASPRAACRQPGRRSRGRGRRPARPADGGLTRQAPRAGPAGPG
jgi:hypothetical protein